MHAVLPFAFLSTNIVYNFIIILSLHCLITSHHFLINVCLYFYVLLVQGAMCAVCADNYFSDQGSCQECTDAHMITTTMMVYLSLAVVALGGVLAALYLKYQRGESLDERMSCIASRASLSSGRGSAAGSTAAAATKTPPEEETEESEEEAPTRGELVALWLHKSYRRLIGKLKIIIVTFQVVSSVPASLDVSMPSSFTKFVDSLNFLNLSLVAAFPVSCSSRFTFIDQLVLTTLVPLAIVLMLMLFFFVEYAYHRRIIQKNRSRRAGEKAAKFTEVKTRYLNYVFYLSYLVMPSVSTTIFATFICTSIDPDGETGGSDGDERYLAADMSISCSSDYYRGGVLYACLMIVVYPGIAIILV
jgi:uncharacterized membrane protein